MKRSVLLALFGLSIFLCTAEPVRKNCKHEKVFREESSIVNCDVEAIKIEVASFQVENTILYQRAEICEVEITAFKPLSFGHPLYNWDSRKVFNKEFKPTIRKLRCSSLTC